MKDAYTNFREIADGNLTATETSPAIELGPAPLEGHNVVVHVPESNANGDTLNITFTQSATQGGAYTTFHTVPELTGTVVGRAGAGVKRVAVLKNTLPWVKCVMTVAGGSADFGDVAAGVDIGQRANVLTVGD